MFCASRQHRAFILGVVLLGAILICSIAEASRVDHQSIGTDQLLLQADNSRTSDHAKFLELLKTIQGKRPVLSESQQLYLRFLEAWELAYESNDVTAIPLLNAIASESVDVTLAFRAEVTVVNILANQSRYEEAFSRLSQLLNQLPKISNRNARSRALSTAAYVYEEAGQYDLASNYADMLVKDSPVDSDDACKGTHTKLAALYKLGKLDSIEKKFSQGIELCVKVGDNLYANNIRFYLASLDMQRGKTSTAIELLQKNYAEVKRLGYPWLISQFDALLAEAYWIEGATSPAREFAMAAVEASTKNKFAEPLTAAYRILYLVARKAGDVSTALAYHEKYMAADKGYLNEISARSMAFQVVNQQVLAKKLQLDTLNKQNQILKLQQSLGAKAVEASRLYIILLLTILASIAFWAYRLKRSQMSFMKLARRDGLTGIFNRQHFVASAERQLQYCEKSGRVAGLIVIDLDNFKTVNDTHGHAVGDHILKRAVAACEAHLRSTDVFGRLGGEEFGILMPECDKDMVAGRADLIRMAIASVSDSEDSPGVTVSASFGVSSTTQSGYNLRQLLIHADKALYDAKRGGRNRVVVFAATGTAVNDPFNAMPLDRR